MAQALSDTTVSGNTAAAGAQLATLGPHRSRRTVHQREAGGAIAA